MTVPSRGAGVVERRSRRLPGWAAATAGGALVLAAVAVAAIPRVFRAPTNPDTVTWIDRSIVPWWFPEPRIKDASQRTWEYSQVYYYAVHHPTVARIFYRTALFAMGVHDRPTYKWDYGTSVEENERRGNVPPKWLVRNLRALNVGVFALTALMLYGGLAWATGSRFWGALATLPVVLDPTWTADFRAVLPYIGTDTLFFLWQTAFWLEWLWAAKRGTAATAALGVVGGLAVATKVNAAFMLAGACLYFVVCSRGWGRVVKPLVLGMVSLAVFLALNPVYWGDGLGWTIQVFGDVKRVMLELKGTADLPWATYTRWEVVLAAFPHILFAVPAALVLTRAQREWWFAPTAFWSASIIVLNVALIYMPLPRYSAPVRAAFLTIVMLSAITALRGARTGGACGKQADRQVREESA